MVIFYKVTWEEFEKIIKILQNYKECSIQINHEDAAWFESILNLFSNVKKQPYNIDIGEIKKEDLRRIAAIIDMWGVIDEGAYDLEADNLSSKLQKIYFKTFNESAFHESR